MKTKNLISALFVLSLISCNDIIEENLTINGTAYRQCEVSNKRSYDEALFIAKQSISMLDSNNGTRGIAPSRSINLDEGTIVICSDDIMTRSLGVSESDTLMYVFNFNDDQGFAIVSAEKTTEGLIAVTEFGHYDPSDTTDTGFNRYMAAAKKYIKANSNKETSNPNRAQAGFLEIVDTIGVVNISPRISVRWGQNCHEGEFCPNHKSGCTITAAAMIMSYFKYPAGIFLTYDNYSFRSLNWDGMITYVSRFQNGLLNEHDATSCINEDHKSVGYLCRQLGYMAGSTYCYGNPSIYNYTETSNYNMMNVLTTLGYTLGDYRSYQYLANTNTLLNQLSQGKLIMMRGENIFGDGHSWVIDGIEKFTIHYQYYEYGYTHGMPDPPILMDEQYNTYRYNHINWGSDGFNNGYFNDGVFSVYGTSRFDVGCPTYLPPNNTELQEYTYENDLKFFSVDKQ